MRMLPHQVKLVGLDMVLHQTLLHLFDLEKNKIRGKKQSYLFIHYLFQNKSTTHPSMFFH